LITPGFPIYTSTGDEIGGNDMHTTSQDGVIELTSEIATGYGSPKNVKPAVLPVSVRYVKNGAAGRWWRAAKADRQVHIGWSNIPATDIVAPDYLAIEKRLKEYWGDRQGCTQDINQLHCLIDAPSRHVWITFEDGCMWWCTVRDGIVGNPDGESKDRGHAWLACDRPWSNKSIGGRLLAIADLPGTVTTVAGFKGTVCQPKAWEAILRILNDDADADAMEASHARAGYERAIEKVVRRLSPKDFEQLIDLILVRSGWARISTLGKTREGVDLEVQNLAANEIAFVQVKSAATQAVLDDYISRFQERRGLYSRMIFAVHSPSSNLTLPSDLPIQLWTGNMLSRLTVRLGLGEWAEGRLS